MVCPWRLLMPDCHAMKGGHSLGVLPPPESGRVGVGVTLEIDPSRLACARRPPPFRGRWERVRVLRSVPAGCRRGVMGGTAPHIDAGEQEQPHHVDEVPIPGGELKAEVLLWREMARVSA